MIDAHFAIFPKPKVPSYSLDNPNLVWIPRHESSSVGVGVNLKVSQNKIIERIPCMFLTAIQPTDKIILYFHGNCEDIGHNEFFFYPLKDQLKCHILCVEYPSYGQYKDAPPLCEKSILDDAEIIYRFLINKVGLLEK